MDDVCYVDVHYHLPGTEPHKWVCGTDGGAATGDTRAVTCQDCKDSSAFVNAVAKAVAEEKEFAESQASGGVSGDK